MSMMIAALALLALATIVFTFCRGSGTNKPKEKQEDPVPDIKNEVKEVKQTIVEATEVEE